jgi:hypothetical protein
MELFFMEGYAPVSFTGKALDFGLQTNVLFPTNKDQSKLNSTVGKAGRFVARYAYTTAVQIFLSLPGAAFHFGKAAVLTSNALINREKVKTYGAIILSQPRYKPSKNALKRESERAKNLRAHAWKHVKAGGQDLAAFVFLIPNIVLPIMGNLPALNYGYRPILATTRFQPQERRFTTFTKYAIKNSTNYKFDDEVYPMIKLIFNSKLTAKQRETVEKGVSGFFEELLVFLERVR